jgi:hypothetical protein
LEVAEEDGLALQDRQAVAVEVVGLVAKVKMRSAGLAP